MALVINHNQNGVSVHGDKEVIEKAGEFDISTVDISQYRVDAETLSTLHEYAQYKGEKTAQEYVALKAQFLKRQELARAELDKPKESNTPAITTQSIRPTTAE